MSFISRAEAMAQGELGNVLVSSRQSYAFRQIIKEFCRTTQREGVLLVCLRVHMTGFGELFSPAGGFRNFSNL